MQQIPVTRTGGVPATLTLVDPRQHRRAVHIVRRHVRAALATCSTSFSSEIVRTRRVEGPVQVSPLLAETISAALDAARLTDGAYDPTARAPRRDGPLVGCPGTSSPPRPAPGWQQVHLAGLLLNTPHQTTLWLEPLALALAAQKAATQLALRCGGGLVVVGSTAAAGGRIREWDLPGRLLGPHESCSWSGPSPVVDPTTGRQVLPTWREVVVTADSATTAAALVHAAPVWALLAPERIAHLGASARLTRLDGEKAYVA